MDTSGNVVLRHSWVAFLLNVSAGTEVFMGLYNEIPKISRHSKDLTSGRGRP